MDTALPAPDPARLRQAAGAVATTLSALANENRLLLLCQLCQGEKSVGELEQLLDIHQPTLSQQLGVLRTEGLVRTRREGKRIYYAVGDPKLHRLLATLLDLYCPLKDPLP
ncbi:metalloregulator ArsR/SmtB family transcription factor [Phaeospirillum tilakii]|uniref:Metalloregulator ArsR/SmtB family transcription factor n=1 Tax=Phaeospirillum tilakii TaxID=741673 RepID=A0ABW5CB01_9PROT